MSDNINDNDTFEVSRFREEIHNAVDLVFESGGAAKSFTTLQAKKAGQAIKQGTNKTKEALTRQARLFKVGYKWGAKGKPCSVLRDSFKRFAQDQLPESTETE